MEISIRDPRTQNAAEVSDLFRLKTESVTQDEGKLAASLGHAYNLNTGNITLTNATKTPVMFLKNTGDVDLLVDKIFFILGSSTGGSGNLFIEVVRNPLAGTIVTNAVAVSMNSNRNFGSNNTIAANAYKGATGNTMTDGTDSLGTIATASNTIVVDAGSTILKKGSSIGINFTAPVGNTSMIAQFALSIYEKTI